MIAASSRKYALPTIRNNSIGLYDIWNKEVLFTAQAKYTILDGKGDEKRITIILQQDGKGNIVWDFAPRTRRVVSQQKLNAVRFQLNRDMGPYGSGVNAPLYVPYFDSDGDQGYRVVDPEDVRSQFKTDKAWSAFIQ